MHQYWRVEPEKVGGHVRHLHREGQKDEGGDPEIAKALEVTDAEAAGENIQIQNINLILICGNKIDFCGLFIGQLSPRRLLLLLLAVQRLHDDPSPFSVSPPGKNEVPSVLSRFKMC